MGDEKKCLNCGAELTDRFCASCGQRDINPGISLKEVVSDFLSYNFSIDGPIWRTLRLLVLNPGKLFKAYIAGERRSHYRPIQFFVVSTLIYFALAEVIGYDPLRGQFDGGVDPKAQPYMQKVEATTRYMVKNINNFLFFLVFSIGGVMKVTHWKRGTFAEFLVLGFYVTGFYILFSVSDLVGWSFDINLGSTRIFVFIAYFAFAYATFKESRRVLNFIYGLVLACLAFLVYFMASFWTSWFLAN